MTVASPMTPRQFLYFTALTLPVCVLLILFFDQPLARFFHAHTLGAKPFFQALTDSADSLHEKLLTTHLLGLPVLYLAPAVAYLIGRWVLKKPGATLFLILLLTHLASIIASNVLKGTVHRLRPEVLLGAGYQGLGLWAAGPHNDSFPSSHVASYFSLFLPLIFAFPRWRLPLLVLPALIGIGRLVLGAHYVSDVWFSVWLALGFTVLFGQLYGRRWA